MLAVHCSFQVLKLLIMAWDRRLIFTIGTSSTTGETDTVVWNEVHHKTEFGSNLTGHGYPDTNYLDNVMKELAAQGVGRTPEGLRLGPHTHTSWGVPDLRRDLWPLWEHRSSLTPSERRGDVDDGVIKSIQITLICSSFTVTALFLSLSLATLFFKATQSASGLRPVHVIVVYTHISVVDRYVFFSGDASTDIICHI